MLFWICLISTIILANFVCHERVIKDTGNWSDSMGMISS